MIEVVDADYLVVGAGAAGMAFTDALITHDETARVLVVDRRHGVGGHWLGAYPFVRLHQASSFYGVASRVLGGGRRQTVGPEAGLFERAGQAQVCAYYAQLAADLEGTGRVTIRPGSDHVGDGTVVSLVSGRRTTVPSNCRVVDARYLAPDIPAELPPRFSVGAGARVVPVNALAILEEPPGRFVVVGSGKTATDAVVWLLGQGVDPDAVCWVRPRDPWTLNRDRVQPDAAVYLGLVADMMQSCAEGTTLDEVFLGLEATGVMRRIDRTVTPTMAKAPTLGDWELERLRSIEDVVRLGRVREVRPGRLDLTEGTVEVGRDALVVNCAADGLKNPPLRPIWAPEAITLQPVRAGFPCFGAALTGYVEATRRDRDDAVKNGICAPSSYGNTLEDWARMTIRGTRNTAAFNAEPDVRDWANRCALNPARVPPDQAPSAALDEATTRIQRWTPPALDRLTELVGAQP